MACHPGLTQKAKPQLSRHFRVLYSECHTSNLEPGLRNSSACQLKAMAQLAGSEQNLTSDPK